MFSNIAVRQGDIDRTSSSGGAPGSTYGVKSPISPGVKRHSSSAPLPVREHKRSRLAPESNQVNQVLCGPGLTQSGVGGWTFDDHSQWQPQFGNAYASQAPQPPMHSVERTDQSPRLESWAGNASSALEKELAARSCSDCLVQKDCSPDCGVSCDGKDDCIEPNACSDPDCEGNPCWAEDCLDIQCTDQSCRANQCRVEPCLLETCFLDSSWDDLGSAQLGSACSDLSCLQHYSEIAPTSFNAGNACRTSFDLPSSWNQQGSELIPNERSIGHQNHFCSSAATDQSGFAEPTYFNSVCPSVLIQQGPGRAFTSSYFTASGSEANQNLDVLRHHGHYHAGCNHPNDSGCNLMPLVSQSHQHSGTVEEFSNNTSPMMSRLCRSDTFLPPALDKMNTGHGSGHHKTNWEPSNDSSTTQSEPNSIKKKIKGRIPAVHTTLVPARSQKQSVNHVKIEPSPGANLTVQDNTTSVCKWRVAGSSSTESHNVCMRQFSSDEELWQHVKAEHTSHILEEYRCQWVGCDRKGAFATRSKLERHLIPHTGYKEHKCRDCDAAFSLKQQLDNHIRIHTGDTPFKCLHCEQLFKTAQARDDHQRRHAGVKAFKCRICGIACTDASNRSKHEKTHREEVYKCLHEGCSGKAKRWDNIKRHFESSGHCPELLNDLKAQKAYKKTAEEIAKADAFRYAQAERRNS